MRSLMHIGWLALLGLTVGAAGQTGAPAIYHVDPAGDDQADGSAATPWATLQHAAGRVRPGDRVEVRPGDYVGFYLTTSGTAAAPITFAAQADVRIVEPNRTTRRDGINLELVSHVVVEGFSVSGMPRAGIRAVGNPATAAAGIVIRQNTADRNGTWGIFTAYADDLLIENNIASRSGTQHGIYVSNSGDRPVVRGNRIWGNRGCGIHLNGDFGAGGDGIISAALIEGNVIVDNGGGGGSAINLDGVQDSLIQNNLIVNARASGISLFRIDGGGPSTGNRVVNNTVLMAPAGRWALNLHDGSANTVVVNNILFHPGRGRGSINASANSLPGLISDFNLLVDNLSANRALSTLSLARWRALTGQDTRSRLAIFEQLFVASDKGDFRLREGSPAVDAGSRQFAPAVDLLGIPRPSGPAVDIGAYERPVEARPPAAIPP